jgi:hypothetical protein
MTYKNQINIARLIYNAYPHADLLPIDPEKDCRDLQVLLAKVTSENIGDSLFRFIVVEIVEGSESTLTGAVRVLGQAKVDIEAVLKALQCQKFCQDTCAGYFRELLKYALKYPAVVKDDCPECGAGPDEREFTGKDFLGIEAIHMHYTCKKCGSEITEEFTLSDVFIDNT